MSRSIVKTEHAPKAAGPYSQGVIAEGKYVFVAGQVGIDPATGQLAEGLEAQAEQALKNVQAIVEAAGATMNDVVKVTVLLNTIADFAKLNAIYGTFFTENPPARATFGGLELPLGALVEVECIAVLEN